MALFDGIAQETIKKNNKDIYEQLKKFLTPEIEKSGFQDLGDDPPKGTEGARSGERKFLEVRGVGGASGGSQIPCSLIITSNESASSIDTQFEAMCSEMSEKI